MVASKERHRAGSDDSCGGAGARACSGADDWAAPRGRQRAYGQGDVSGKVQEGRAEGGVAMAPEAGKKGATVPRDEARSAERKRGEKKRGFGDAS